VKLIVSRAAAAGLERLRFFLAKTSPAAAGRAAAILASAIHSLDTMPERGRPSELPNIRDLIVPFGRSAYVLRCAYSVENHEIVVLRVWHGREARE
jgi:plasmid stabilization system protein ParE